MKIYKVTKQQLKNLQENGSILVNGITYQYDETAVYILDDPTAPEYRLRWNTTDRALEITKDGTAVSQVTPIYAYTAGNAFGIQKAGGSAGDTLNYDQIKAALDSTGVTASRTGKTLIIS